MSYRKYDQNFSQVDFILKATPQYIITHYSKILSLCPVIKNMTKKFLYNFLIEICLIFFYFPLQFHEFSTRLAAKINKAAEKCKLHII
jgi:hypothetical protein